MPDLKPQPPDLVARLQARARPAGSPAQFQSWRDLLFLHWRVPPDQVQATLPAGLTVDTFEESAWIGVVPFFMRDIRLRGLPAVPYLSNFLELNLRTYAFDRSGIPGVWFYTLEANRALAVWIARTYFHLPYHTCAMRSTRLENGAIDYRSRRRRGRDRRECRFEYRPVGDSRLAEPGSLEFFLVERYVLFAHDPRTARNRIGRVAHAPYSYSCAEVSAWDTNLFSIAGLPPPAGAPDHIAWSPGVDVEIFALEE